MRGGRAGQKEDVRDEETRGRRREGGGADSQGSYQCSSGARSG